MKSYKFNKLCVLNIESHSNVFVKEARSANFIEVEVTGSDKNIDLVTVEVYDDELFIDDNSHDVTSISNTEGKTVFSGNKISNKSNFFSTKNSGTVNINGEIINFNQNTEEDEVIPTVITIYTSLINLNLLLHKAAVFESDVPFITSSVQTSNKSRVNIKSTNLDILSSNSSLVEAEVLGGTLSINSSKSSQVIVQGAYTSATVFTSLKADVRTEGHCLGDYIASASSSSYICNTGKIDGKAKKNISNNAAIRFY